MTPALYAYVGSRTTRERHARGDGISVYRVDTRTGGLELVQVVSELVNPSFLALNRQQDRLYTVHGDGHEISVFARNCADGTLHFLQRQACGGRNPVHLALDPSGAFLVVSDHLGDPAAPGGALVVLPVQPDGRLGAVCQRVPLEGMPGPHHKEQPHAKPHFNPFDPGGRFVVVPDKGLDRVFVFRFEDGRLSPAATPWMDTREGAGPRHTAFHPSGRFAYTVNELDSTVQVARFDPATGTLQAVQVVSTLPDSFVGHSRAAEIEVSADGRTVYASNRGHDSIAVFGIDADTGRLRWQGAVPSAGKTPRFFALAPAGAWMFVLNEDSDSIVAFAVDAVSGTPSESPQQVACGSPVCMVFAAG